VQIVFLIGAARIPAASIVAVVNAANTAPLQCVNVKPARSGVPVVIERYHRRVGELRLVLRGHYLVERGRVDVTPQGLSYVSWIRDDKRRILSVA
jgi:hypothetical protein